MVCDTPHCGGGLEEGTLTFISLEKLTYVLAIHVIMIEIALRSLARILEGP